MYRIFSPVSEKTLFLVLFDATPFGLDTMTMHIIDCAVQIKFCTVIDRCLHAIFSSAMASQVQPHSNSL